MAIFKSSINKKKKLWAHIVYIFKKYIRPGFFVLVGLLLLAWLISWLWLGGFVKQAWTSTTHSFLSFTADQGLAIENVLIEGRKNTDINTIYAVMNIAKGDPLLSVAPNEAKELLERISWVKTARVERRLPDTVFIKVFEREPVAIWKKEKGDILIDEEGVALTSENIRSYGVKLYLYGKDANTILHEVLALLRTQPEIMQKVNGVARINARRWDVLLDNNIRVKLPEKEPELAIATLAKSQSEEKILNRPIKEIDLRQPGRLIVKTSRGKIEDLIPLIE